MDCGETCRFVNADWRMKMETKFTKGPWSAYIGSGGIVEVHGDNGLEIINWQGFDGNYNFKQSKARANAHLIAAAPEMYEMLQNILDERVGVARNDYVLDDEIEKLLSKARGEQ